MLSFIERGKKRFCVGNDTAYPIAAGGCIFYKYQEGRMMILLQCINNIYEDIGGKIDMSDNDIYDTVAREVAEETNYLFGKSEYELKQRLMTADWVYVARAKYIIFFLRAQDSEVSVNEKDFGDIELHTGIHRTFRWVDNINGIKLSRRICVNQLLYKLYELNYRSLLTNC